MAKRILMLLEHPFPPDIRVEKEAKALLSAGFDLSLLCVGDSPGRNWHGMKIYNIPAATSPFEKLKSLAFVINSDFLRYLELLLRREEFDVIHVHDLRLVPTALWIKQKYGVKVVADFHENYPAALREWSKSFSGIKGFLFRWFNDYDKWLTIEKKAVYESDRVIAVVEEMKERLRERYPACDDKVVVVSNLEDVDFIRYPVKQDILSKYRHRFVVLYTGGFGVHRGIDVAIQGMRYIEKDILLLLIGKGNRKIEQEYRHLISKYELHRKVEIQGWVPFEEIPSYQEAASVCIVPHYSNEHTDNTIPHKLYQYMMKGKPVVVSSCPPLARVVKEARAGLVFEAGSAQDFAEKILQLYEDENMRSECSRNALDYIFSQGHTWQNESKKLIELYKDL